MSDTWMKTAAAFVRRVLLAWRGRPAVRIEIIEPGDGPPWGTLSGLTAHPADPARLHAVTDKDSAPVRIIGIDVSRAVPRATGQIAISAPGFHGLDPEAIAARPDGGFWLASEGGEGDSPPNLLLELDAAGRVLRSIGLPAAIASRMPDKGFEGLALQQTPLGERLCVAFQAPLAGDPAGLTRIGAVDAASGQWTFFHYPLQPLASGGFSGLSELVHLGRGRFAAIERDGKGGPNAVKWLTVFDLAGLAGAPPATAPPLIAKRLALDLVPVFKALGHKIEKEIEGLAIAADGQVYALTDNDNERPTVLMRLGKAAEVFGG